MKKMFLLLAVMFTAFIEVKLMGVLTYIPVSSIYYLF